MRLLVLGGTGEARELAARADGFEVITSLAGRVQNPVLPVGEVRVGGFGGVEGLANWLQDNDIGAVVDATHPFAANISENAAAACREVGLSQLVLRRAAWTAGPLDRWIHVPSLAEAAGQLPGDRVFLAIGRQGVHHFAGDESRWFLIRAIDPPDGEIPPQHELLLRRGPFTLKDDLELMRSYAIDAVVSKNSGGDLAEAKLEAARILGIPVVMVDRPPLPAGVHVADSVDAALAWLAATRELEQFPG
ncbi:cobalt-precorrin-6A reductase [Smaragdicoccus niigatensis]|uniref:cobalt-precorrin-6A reductase n=1 Tax=Smaragdicoccus niigatensis TaxID=359359 RepID=UPI00059174CB|nr:cobalt-precorrin-6A reductase [Smaragdicoccus niigatensis]